MPQRKQNVSMNHMRFICTNYDLSNTHTDIILNTTNRQNLRMLSPSWDQMMSWDVSPMCDLRSWCTPQNPLLERITEPLLKEWRWMKQLQSLCVN